MKLPEVGMTEEQRYLFDTFGYFIVPKAISSVQVQQLRSTLHNGTEQFDPVSQEQGPLHWSEIWRDLIDLPNISPILEELVGNAVLTKGRTVRAKDGRQTLASFGLDHLNIHTHIKQGDEGAVLHGG